MKIIKRQNEQLVFSADKFLNLTPKMLIKRQQKNEVFRINEDLSFAAGDGSSKMNKEDEEELEEDLLMFGAAPGAIDQIETSYMVRIFHFVTYVTKYGVNCDTFYNKVLRIIWKMPKFESKRPIMRSVHGYINTMD